MRKVCLLFLFIVFFVTNGFAQQGKDGSKTINTNNAIVNEYTSLTVNAGAGSTSINVGDNTLNAHGRFAAPLSQGDLLMIIQLQGASLNSTNDSTWGEVTNYNGVGTYEFTQVSGISGASTINICPLKNNYNFTSLPAGKVEVVRVPRYTSLTINSGDTLTCDTWEGSGTATGGIVAVEVLGNTTINGAINVTGKGFRGGALDNSVGNYPMTNYVDNDVDDGAEKGESIAGYETDYNIYGGMYCRGAAANGGGGGDGHNGAGGGGANAGNLSLWTGNGNPDIKTDPVNYPIAWNLEYVGFSKSTSSGGGRGGYTWCTSQNNPYTTPPGSPDWGGDDRREAGGKGGRPLDYSTGGIFFGGGGGAGQEDNNAGGAGGNGGGIIYELSYGTVSGSGSVISNGNMGQTAVCQTAAGDPPGGGGGGGTVIISSVDAISGIALFAQGGAGGNQDLTNFNTGQPDESEGAGGGGGGGYIAASNGGLTTSNKGGPNGTTNSLGVAPFLPNGGTAGGSGVDSSITISYCGIQNLSAVIGPAVVCPGRTYIYSVTANCGAPAFVWTLPTGWTGTSTTDSITVVAGTTEGSIIVSNCPFDTAIAVIESPAPVKPNLPKDTVICGAINLPLNSGSTGFHYLWSTGDTTNSIVATDTGTYWIIVSSSCDTVSDSTRIGQKGQPVVFLGHDTSYCSNFTRVLNAGDSATGYKWSTGATTQTITVTKDGTYWVTVTNNCGETTDSIKFLNCEGGYVIPNAFTPGGENANSLLGLLKTGNGPTTLLYFRIYSRWGQLIFSTNDDQAKWDGRFNGLPQPIGVYVYVVSYNDSFGVNKLLKGNITLLR